MSLALKTDLNVSGQLPDGWTDTIASLPPATVWMLTEMIIGLRKIQESKNLDDVQKEVGLLVGKVEIMKDSITKYHRECLLRQKTSLS